MAKQTVCWMGAGTEGFVVVDAATPRDAAEYVVDQITWLDRPVKVEAWKDDYLCRPWFAKPDYVINHG